VKSFFDAAGKPHAGISPEEINEAFRYACGYGVTQVAEYLLDRGTDIAGHSGDHQTGLHYAAMGGHLATVKLLLSRNARADLEDSVHGGTPLGWALHGWYSEPKRGQFYEVVAALVAAGAPVKPKWLEAGPTDDNFIKRVLADPRMRAALLGELGP